jgi:hypothetical protein
MSFLRRTIVDSGFEMGGWPPLTTSGCPATTGTPPRDSREAPRHGRARRPTRNAALASLTNSAPTTQLWPMRASISRHPVLVAAALLAALVAVPGAHGPAHAGDLAAFLERAEKMGTVNEKVEADVTIRESDGSEKKAHLVIDPAGGGTAILDRADTGWKSETPLGWKEGKATASAGGSSSKITVDDTLAGSDLRGIDFFPFWKTDYSKAFTSDENTMEQTVSLYADKGRPYSLYVITFDKTKLMPRMIKYYKDTFNNLVRIRTDKDWVMVGSRPRPKEILIKDFAGNTLRTYAFDWKLAQ